MLRMNEFLHQAADKRAPLPNEQTNAFRLVDGRGDGLPGIEIDQLGEHWLVSTRDTTMPPELHTALKKSGRSIYHKHLDPREKTSPQHLYGPAIDTPFTIRENGIAFELSFHSGYSQGIFLDQRDNRLALRETMQPGTTLLNTFAYTGAFSVAAALAGATTTTLDLSQPYLDWTKRNFTHNQLDSSAHYFCKGDTFHWLQRFARQGRSFDCIVLDPPTFSRDHKGKVFRVERDYGSLVALAHACLTPHGRILACTNCRQLNEANFITQIHNALPRSTRLTPAPMPLDFTAPPYLKSVWIEPA